MSGTAKMRVRKSKDSFVVILITGAVPVGCRIVFAANIVRLLVGVWRQLDRSKRHRRAGIRVSHFLCADQRIDVLDIIIGFLSKQVCL